MKKKLVEGIIGFIVKLSNSDCKIHADELGKKLKLNEEHLKFFKRQTGWSLKERLIEEKMFRSRLLIETSDITIKEGDYVTFWTKSSENLKVKV